MVYSVIGQFLVSKFAVVLFNGDSTQILESQYQTDELIALIGKYDISKIASSITKDKILNKFPDFEKFGVELIVPIQLQGQTRGLIFLGKRINNLDYSSSDIEFIYSVGNLAIISLENKRLFKEELEKQKMEEELELAKEIQKNLLPRSLPKFNKFDIASGGTFSGIIL